MIKDREAVVYGGMTGKGLKVCVWARARVYASDSGIPSTSPPRFHVQSTFDMFGCSGRHIMLSHVQAFAFVRTVPSFSISTGTAAVFGMASFGPSGGLLTEFLQRSLLDHLPPFRGRRACKPCDGFLRTTLPCKPPLPEPRVFNFCFVAVFFASQIVGWLHDCWLVIPTRRGPIPCNFISHRRHPRLLQVVHCYLDFLWQMGPQTLPNEGFRPDGVRSIGVT